MEAVRNIKMHQPDQTLPFRRLESRREEKAHQNTDTWDGKRCQPGGSLGEVFPSGSATGIRVGGMVSG